MISYFIPFMALVIAITYLKIKKKKKKRRFSAPPSHQLPT
tara:strand:+ start:55 stop:174 length:120 start_codon:yes stop_codon:yes gene_type:complete